MGYSCWPGGAGPTIERFQLQQDKAGVITVLIVSNQDLEFSIYSQFSKMLGSDFTLNVKTVKNIPCTNRGKYRYIQQNLNLMKPK